ncbi:hypothetical protein EYF80_055186 [Liparis tanakae]|uniref:Uncharacterized protein n=1 Tax=Liparis tanakae TaxID=230148 RepID=A0A4Z2F115_9TELE|nr:hypothetical protein EYF80_055186 [Liparis tanakae]
MPFDRELALLARDTLPAVARAQRCNCGKFNMFKSCRRPAPGNTSLLLRMASITCGHGLDDDLNLGTRELNITGNTRLLGRLKPATTERIAQPASGLRAWRFRVAPTRSPKNQNQSTPVMAMTVWQALFFDGSTRTLFPPTSPGPRRIRTRRTEKLQ